MYIYYRLCRGARPCGSTYLRSRLHVFTVTSPRIYGHVSTYLRSCLHVFTVTSSRIYGHVFTYLRSRLHVFTVTSPRIVCFKLSHKLFKKITSEFEIEVLKQVLIDRHTFGLNRHVFVPTLYFPHLTQ